MRYLLTLLFPLVALAQITQNNAPPPTLDAITWGIVSSNANRIVMTNAVRTWATVAVDNTIQSPIPPAPAGTFANHILTNVIGRTTGKNPTNDVWYIAHPRINFATNPPWMPPWIGCIFDATYPTNIILTNDHFVLNDTFWLSDIPSVSAVSSVPSYRLEIQDGGQEYEVNATLITPRHAIRVQHGSYGIGAWLRFTDTNGVHYSRTAIDVELFDYLGNDAVWPAGDSKIYLLDEALPDSVVPVKFLPDTGTNATKWAGTSPTLRYDQWKRFTIVSPRESAPLFDSPPTACGGDSGSAAFYIVNTELVLSSAWNATVYSNRVALVNARNDVTNQIKIVNLSSFQ